MKIRENPRDFIIIDFLRTDFILFGIRYFIKDFERNWKSVYRHPSYRSYGRDRMFSQSDLATLIAMKEKSTLIDGTSRSKASNESIRNSFLREFLAFFFLFFFFWFLFSSEETPSNENEINRSDLILIFQVHHPLIITIEDATYLLSSVSFDYSA